jgi:P-type Cu+ transporter
VYEVLSSTGAGYFDSMSGIVFFMLLGRVLQEKTWQQLSFDRDFTSYFPIAAVKIEAGKELPVPLEHIKSGDTLRIHSHELIPADGICTRGKACIDYSFVTGESLPVNKEMGEMVYAGGKQTGGAIEILVMKEVTQSYLTRLWANQAFREEKDTKSVSFVHLLSRWFTYIVLLVAGITACYWFLNDQAQLWNAVTAVLIVACPCALLLSNTFTNGNILRILAKRKLYLRSAQTIEDISGITHIVFDKTGTLTTTAQQVQFIGKPLTKSQQLLIASVAAQSSHPLSRAIVAYLPRSYRLPLNYFCEHAGKGIEAIVDNEPILLGSQDFVAGKPLPAHDGPCVFVVIGGRLLGYFSFSSQYRNDIQALMHSLSGKYRLSLLSGDHDAEKATLQKLMGADAILLFNQQPEQKLQYIQALQQKGERVLMIGDGLNDAGALKQSNAGIALTESTNNFTPASDAILQAAQLNKLPVFIRLCKANRQIVLASFMISILYNIIGIGLAVQGLVSPLVAAILMPASSLSILLVTFGCSNLIAKWLK